MADCSSLPLDVLNSIAKRLFSFEDLVAFGAACRSWRLAATKENFDYSQQQIPWLMLFSSDVESLAEVYSLSKKKTYMLPHPREAYNEKLIYSSSGWIMTIDYSFSLFHPLSHAHIKLPNQTLFYMNKFALSASPSQTSEYLIMAIFHPRHRKAGHLAFWRPGDPTWTTTTDEYILVYDITYHKGRFYAVDSHCRVLVLNIDDQDDRVVVKAVSLLHVPKLRSLEMLYLVEAGESLLVVEGLVRCGETFGFEVYEVNVRDGTFVRVKNLGDRALFLGYNSSSFSVKASNFNGCKANWIYFTDGETRMCNIYAVTNTHERIFHLKYEGIEQHCFRDHECRNRLHTLLWVQPTF